MFRILKDQNAPSTDLAETYVRAIELGEKLTAEKGEIHQKLMELQVASFDAKPDKKLLSLKTEMDALIIRLDACKFGQGRLKNRLGEVLQKEAALRLERIQEELGTVAAKEKELKRQYLDLCAGAALVREKLKGAETSYNGNVLVRLTPDPKFNFQLLSGEEQAYYSAKVGETRQESVLQDFSGTIAGKRSTLVEEQSSLQKMLSGDPQEEAERLLNRLIPPAPEAAVVAESPKSHPEYESRAFERDYGAGQGPDYGDGLALPYRGVDEVLHDRANS